MGESVKRWRRDLVFVPLITGAILVVFTFVLPIIFAKERELSYIVDAPTVYLSEETVRDVKVEVNGIETKSLYAYKVELWNSGDIPLKDIAVRYVFTTQARDFEVFAIRHVTDPPYEFGGIQEQRSEKEAKRFVYSLLNAGDRISVVLLCNAEATLQVFAKAEGLVLKEVTQKPKSEWVSVVTPLLGMVASMISLLVLRATRISIEKTRKRKSTRKKSSCPGAE